MEELRESIRIQLKPFIKVEKNLNLLEKAIFEASNNDLMYKEIAYEILFLMTTGMKSSDVLEKLKSNQVYWSNSSFHEVAMKKKEQDDFTISPFQVEEGVLKCPKCSGCKSFSYSKQTRSADEPMTTFATCYHCKHKWTYSG